MGVAGAFMLFLGASVGDGPAADAPLPPPEADAATHQEDDARWTAACVTAGGACIAAPIAAVVVPVALVLFASSPVGGAVAGIAVLAGAPLCSSAAAWGGLLAAGRPITATPVAAAAGISAASLVLGLLGGAGVFLAASSLSAPVEGSADAQPTPLPSLQLASATLGGFLVAGAMGAGAAMWFLMPEEEGAPFFEDANGWSSAPRASAVHHAVAVHRGRMAF